MITDTEGKYNKLKQQYKELELSCYKDLQNFHIELKHVSLGSVRGVALEQQQQQLNQIADLEKRLLEECCTRVPQSNALETVVNILPHLITLLDLVPL